MDGGPCGYSDDEPDRRTISPEEALHLAFCSVEEDHYDLNRRAASRAARLAEAIGWARSHPEIYALAGDDKPSRTAERCVVLEASVRLNLSELAVRTMAHSANEAMSRLPLLWARAREGFTTMAHVEVAVSLLPRFARHPDAVGDFDGAIADLAIRSSPAAFRAKAARLARRIAPLPDAESHADAFAGRRVVVQPDGDGMSWISAYVATPDALAIKRRLTATAKHLSKNDRTGRTRDQLRADLLRDLLRGVGMSTPVKTKVFVTVPLDRLSPAARSSVRRRTPRPGGRDLGQEPLLDTGEAVDDWSAVRMLLNAGGFTRVITDPVTGVILDMDRRSRRVTRQQREWLILHHGQCTRDGCRRPASEADIDHWVPYSSPQRGPTDEANLHPLCDPDHALRDTTRLAFRRRADNTVEIGFPSGYVTRRLLDSLPPLGDSPPF